MDANELTYFGTIKTAHGDGEAAFCIFFFLPRFVIINKDFLQCFIIRFKSFSRISMYRWENRAVLFNISSDIDG